eukprot:scaffold38239_cov66-Phaeocystis_antarctica.AAC.5
MCNWLCLVGMWSLPGNSCIAPPRPVEARCARFALVRTAQVRSIREPSGRALSGRHSALPAVRAGLDTLPKVPGAQALGCSDFSGQNVPRPQSRHALSDVAIRPRILACLLLLYATFVETLLYVPAGHAVSEADSSGQ